MPIQYRISLVSPETHCFDVTLQVDSPDPAGQVFWLPTWIPGSYLIREFARNIVAISAMSGKQPVPLTKLDKQRWQAQAVAGPLTLNYRVYAWDLSVRGAYLDTTRGFFNGTSVFLAVEGQEDAPCEVEIVKPAGKDYKDWEVATALSSDGAKPWGFGRYGAQNYDELIDHPVEIGVFSRIGFKACGVPHELVIAGQHHADLKRLKQDIKKICEAQIGFFGGPAPFARYVFLTLAVGEGYGGLEHRASTALICARDDLPLAHDTDMKPGYRQFLGLVSHEYFHTWNVKRIKPAAFAPYALDREGYTRLLWAFEGITSYYDDLFLLRTGLISLQEYLDLLAQSMTNVQRTPGRQLQTLEEASLDAWVKYYRQDENSPNSLVSYYVKGALAALCLDLTIRKKSSGAKSLDDVMKVLWQRFGQDFDTRGCGIAESEWEAIAQEVAGVDLTGFFNQTLRSVEELPLPDLLAQFGIQSQLRAATGSGDKGGWQNTASKPTMTLGVRTATEGSMVKLTHVLQDGAAQVAGLSAGDLLVALDDLRVTPASLDTLLANRPVGKKRTLLAFRRDELLRFEVEPQLAVADTWGLQPDDTNPVVSDARKAWLGV
ncbi:MAG: PDZ domain-containing protein [Formivibrio sp.]|nr:PDZ domain-containing protein [Formivibrio sp.]